MTREGDLGQVSLFAWKPGGFREGTTQAKPSEALAWFDCGRTLATATECFRARAGDPSRAGS